MNHGGMSVPAYSKPDNNGGEESCKIFVIVPSWNMVCNLHLYSMLVHYLCITLQFTW